LVDVGNKMKQMMPQGSSPAAMMKSAVGWHTALSNPNTRDQAFVDLGKMYGVGLPPSEYQAHVAQKHDEAQISNMLSDFAQSHPHFESVRYTMGQLLSAGVAHDLESAYDKALALNPPSRRNKSDADISPSGRSPNSSSSGTKPKTGSVREAIADWRSA